MPLPALSLQQVAKFRLIAHADDFGKRGTSLRREMNDEVVRHAVKKSCVQ
jgi:hypothetical protein